MVNNDIVNQPEQEMDFVEYLRLWASVDANDQAIRDLHKAAGEIERLRNQVRQLETERDQWQKMAVRNDS